MKMTLTSTSDTRFTDQELINLLNEADQHIAELDQTMEEFQYEVALTTNEALQSTIQDIELDQLHVIRDYIKTYGIEGCPADIDLEHLLNISLEVYHTLTPEDRHIQLVEAMDTLLAEDLVGMEARKLSTAKKLWRWLSGKKVKPRRVPKPKKVPLPQPGAPPPKPPSSRTNPSVTRWIAKQSGLGIIKGVKRLYRMGRWIVVTTSRHLWELTKGIGDAALLGTPIGQLKKLPAVRVAAGVLTLTALGIGFFASMKLYDKWKSMLTQQIKFLTYIRGVISRVERMPEQIGTFKITRRMRRKSMLTKQGFDRLIEGTEEVNQLLRVVIERGDEDVSIDELIESFNNIGYRGDIEHLLLHNKLKDLRLPPGVLAIEGTLIDNGWDTTTIPDAVVAATRFAHIHLDRLANADVLIKRRMKTLEEQANDTPLEFPEEKLDKTRQEMVIMAGIAKKYFELTIAVVNTGSLLGESIVTLFKNARKQNLDIQPSGHTVATF